MSIINMKCWFCRGDDQELAIMLLCWCCWRSFADFLSKKEKSLVRVLHILLAFCKKRIKKNALKKWKKEFRNDAFFVAKIRTELEPYDMAMHLEIQNQLYFFVWLICIFWSLKMSFFLVWVPIKVSNGLWHFGSINNFWLCISFIGNSIWSAQFSSKSHLSSVLKVSI